ncbi:hypothetical protein [Streptomyces sedi]|uniref:DUF7848 domain-containing protein n=1 Tax=Streptomyces sedi TaxID=555059 RepID=A0A5C4UQH8_9ACTN|nr:hypothetical protein [Streptomyces sedi]TNM25792.1 hypothetical protein FH715_26245 [Streptomyces sedi]
MTCAEESPLFDDDTLPVAVWGVQHAQQTSHTRFLFRTEKHWVVVRREDRESEPEGPPAAGGSFAGPAFVGLMCLLTAASGFLPLLTT